MRMVRKRPHQASPSRMSQTQEMLFSGRHALIFHILSEYFMRHCKLTEISIFQINIFGTHSRWMMLKPSPSSCTLLQSSFRKCTPPFGSHNMMPVFPHLVASCFMQSLHFRSHLFLDFRSFPITNKNFHFAELQDDGFCVFRWHQHFLPPIVSYWNSFFCWFYFWPHFWYFHAHLRWSCCQQMSHKEFSRSVLQLLLL